MLNSDQGRKLYIRLVAEDGEHARFSHYNVYEYNNKELVRKHMYESVDRLLDSCYRYVTE